MASLLVVGSAGPRDLLLEAAASPAVPAEPSLVAVVADLAAMLD